MSARGAIDRAISRALAPFPDLVRWWARRTADARVEGDVPWTPYRKAFAEARVAILSTGGFRLPDQPPFECDRGDPSVRRIPSTVDLADVVVDHTHYDTRDARADPNVLLPLDRLSELVREGTVGSVAPTAWSMMGYVPQVDALVEETAPEIADGMRREEVDWALLVPA